jgi:two-component system sensor histidine kinase KdpD
MRNRLLRYILSFFGPLLFVALTSLFLEWASSLLNVQNMALIYLIPVMLSAVIWGLFSGLLAGLISFLAFNYFFIQPYNTLLVHQSQDIITLSIFLVVAVLLSQLIGQTRRAALLAKTKEWEATRMYELISSLAGTNSIISVAETLAEKIGSNFGFEYVEVINTTGSNPEKMPGCYPTGSKPDRVPDFALPMKTQRDEEGSICIWQLNGEIDDAKKRLLGAFAEQGALAVERIRLSQGETKIHVLEESDRLKTSILNSVSHELRSPLAAIKASISSLRSGAVEWEHAARQELLTTIDEETDQLNLLVGNLLDMSRIESGSLEPHLHWNSILEIAKSAAARLKGQLAGHILEFSLPVDLPLVPSDYVLLEQVFVNLFSNSAKYAPEKTRIVVSAGLEKDSISIRVKNQSPHVADEELQNIFEKFHRVTRADKVIGTGLGLSICKGIIEVHGGKIWAENLADGFQFVFTLPILLNGNLPETPKEVTDG